VVSFHQTNKSRPLKPFKSPAAALRWYEWHSTRPVFLITFLYYMVMTWIFRSVVKEFSSVPLADAFYYILAFFCFMPFMSGLVLIIRHYRAWRFGTTRFVLVRPVHSSTLAYAQMRPIIVYWLLVTVFMGVIVMGILFSTFTGRFSLLIFSPDNALLTLTIVYIGSVLIWMSFVWITWRNILFLLSAGILLGICIMLEQTLYPGSNHEYYFPYWAVIMIFSVISGLIYSYVCAWRTRVMNGEVLIVLFIAWILFSAIPFLVFNRIFPPYRQYLSLPAFSFLLAFMFESFAAVPLAWHRRRSGRGKWCSLRSFPLTSEKIKPYRCALIVLPVVILIGLLLFRGYAALWLHQELANRKSNNLLQPSYIKVLYSEVTPDENAALIYKKALTLVKEKRDSDKYLGHHNVSSALITTLCESNISGLDPNYINQLEDEVNNCEDVFKLLEQATTKKKSRFLENLDHEPDYKPFWSLKSLNNLMLSKAVLATHSGNAYGAIKALNSAFAFHRAFANEPVFELYLSSLSLFHDDCKILNYMLNHMQFSDQPLEDLQNSVAENLVSPMILSSICVEFQWEWAKYNKEVLITDPPYVPNYDSSPVPLGNWYRWSGLYDLERAVFLDTVNWFCWGFSWEFPKTYDDISSREMDTIAWKWWTRLDNWFMYQLCCSYRDYFAEALAVQRMACAALAMERYHLEHGNLPDSLCDLEERFVCCSLQDPFGKMAVDVNEQSCSKENAVPASMMPLLKYTRCNEGYILYSVGPNRMDDKGKLSFPVNDSEPRKDDVSYVINCSEKHLTPCW